CGAGGSWERFLPVDPPRPQEPGLRTPNLLEAEVRAGPETGARAGRVPSVKLFFEKGRISQRAPGDARLPATARCVDDRGTASLASVAPSKRLRFWFPLRAPASVRPWRLRAFRADWRPGLLRPAFSARFLALLCSRGN